MSDRRLRIAFVYDALFPYVKGALSGDTTSSLDGSANGTTCTWSAGRGGTVRPMSR